MQLYNIYQEEACELYTEAAQICLEAKKQTQDKKLQEKLTKLTIEALDRAEAIKNKPLTTSIVQPRNIVRPLGNLSLGDDEGGATRGGGGGAGYTEEEIMVLKSTSTVNGREYVPFISADLR